MDLIKGRECEPKENNSNINFVPDLDDLRLGPEARRPTDLYLVIGLRAAQEATASRSWSGMMIQNVDEARERSARKALPTAIVWQIARPLRRLLRRPKGWLLAQVNVADTAAIVDCRAVELATVSFARLTMFVGENTSGCSVSGRSTRSELRRRERRVAMRRPSSLAKRI